MTWNRPTLTLSPAHEWIVGVSKATLASLSPPSLESPHSPYTQAAKPRPLPASASDLEHSSPMATAPAPLSLSASTVPARLRAAAVPAGARGRQPRRGRMVVRAKIREIFMPALSSTMTEGKIVSWSAAEGDRVNKGDAVVVVESDKADMDVETFHDGIVAAVLVQAGESAPVGAPIALLTESEEEVPIALAKAEEPWMGTRRNIERKFWLNG